MLFDMARYEAGHAEKDLEEIAVILRSWHANRESDSVTIQNIREQDFHIGARMMERLVYEVQPERRVKLVIGNTAVRGSSFDKGPYDMYSEHTKILEPQTELIIHRADVYRCYEYVPPKPELYVGGYGVVVELGKVAETLRDGGQLSIVDHPNLEYSQNS